MFPSYGGLKDIVPIVEQLTRLPGRVLLQAASLFSIILTWLGYLVARHATTFVGWIPLAIGIVCVVITAVFGVRRYQLHLAVDQWMENERTMLDAQSETTGVDYSDIYAGEAPSDSHDVVVLNEDGTTYSGPSTSNPSTSRPFENPEEQPGRSVPAQDSHAQRMHDARLESEQRRDTWMPRVEAAQRAAIAVAGGTVNAPYLKSDLRITIVSALLTMAVVPTAIFFSIVALFALM